MNRRSLAALALSGAMLLITAVPALAQAPTPEDGLLFGQHLTELAPTHAVDHGRMFGECVGGLASEGTCEHHME